MCQLISFWIGCNVRYDILLFSVIVVVMKEIYVSKVAKFIKTKKTFHINIIQI